jgi:hypothetical protein
VVTPRAAIRAALVYAALTMALAYPLSTHPATAVLSDSPDTNLELWALAWDAHAFVRQPLSIFDANIYYPQRRTLAYSENFIGSAFLAAPIIWLTGNLVLALNAVSLLSCVLCGAGAYVLARRVGAGEAGAYVAGLVFAFSPPRFLRLDQLHLTTIEWVPFALASLHAYLDEGRARDLRLFIGLFTLQALTSGHGAVFLIVASAIVVAYRVLLGEPIDARRRMKDVGVIGALLVVPTLLLVLPYRAVQAEMELRRSLAMWAVLPMENFLASPSHAHTWLLQRLDASGINDRATATLFPGALTLFLAACAVLPRRVRPKAAVAALLDAALVAVVGVALYRMWSGPLRIRLGESTVLSVRRAWQPWVIAGALAAFRLALARIAPIDPRACYVAWSRHRRDPAALYLVIAAVSVWIVVGPPFGIWPLLYQLPGFNFIRVPSRFVLLAVLGVAVLAGLGFERLTARAVSARVPLAVLVCGLLVAEYAVVPLPIALLRVDPPAIDRWIAAQASVRAIAEVPLANPSDLGRSERRHTGYMLHSTAHWRKTVEGYSGIRPSLFDQLYTELLRFPDEESVRHLAALGVTHVIVHVGEYEPAAWTAVSARLEAYAAWLRLEHEEDGGRVYSIHVP